MFSRASEGIRERFDPRFPHVNPHRLRHTMALATLERLVSGYYSRPRSGERHRRQPGDGLYLTQADPLMVSVTFSGIHQ